jgi:16S rRNA U1498 N3-methylase RsmE
VSQRLAEGASALDGAQAHYLGKVMRVAAGDAVILCDNQTGEWVARVAQAGKRDMVLTVERLRPRRTCPTCGCARPCSRSRRSTGCWKRRPNWASRRSAR